MAARDGLVLPGGMTAALDFLVDRTDLRRCAVEPAAPPAPLAAGEVRLAVARFAFTANNITYGAVGELVGYWNFFPARAGWGRIPVWGFADVVESAHADLAAGERLYGYLPMSTHLVVRAAHVTPAGFVDAAAHRAALPPIYNQYLRTAADPLYAPAREPHLALFRPLFTTAFLLDDFLCEQDAFGARRVLLSSASSKTALGLAALLRQRGGREVVGLTSARNAAFVSRTGYYDRVVTYDAVGGLSADTRTMLVDFAGNFGVLTAIHEHFGARLTYDCQVGLTHWDATAMGATLPGPQPVLFFAPTQAEKRVAEWGAAAFQARVAETLSAFLASADAWLRIVEGRGPAAVEAVYHAMVAGEIDPAEGHMLSLAE